MNTVDLGTLPVGATFIIPWRPEGRNVGELLDVSIGSVSVRVPEHDGTGWETTRWTRGAPVIPTDRSELYAQQNVNSNRNRSLVESPVERVWAICSSMPGADRNAIIAKCVAEGINFSTAKTQYYAWRKAQ